MRDSWWFLVVAIGWSSISTWKAFGAFSVPTKGRPAAWWVHQLSFNFAGVFVGCTAAWIVGRRAWHCVSAETCTGALSWSDAALGLVAFVGITGYLPLAAAGLLNAIGELAKGLIDAAVKLLTRPGP